MQCTTIPSVEYSTSQCRGSEVDGLYYENDYITFKCFSGYEFSPGVRSQITACLGTGVWTVDMNTKKCKRK